MFNVNQNKSSKLYEINKPQRDIVLKRAQDCSLLTLSYIQPENEFSENEILDQKYSSFVSMCINNLSSKFMLSLLPPMFPFFKLKPNRKIIESLKDDKAKLYKIEQNIIQIETDIMDFINTMNYRSKFSEVIKYLIVTGNCLVELKECDNEDLKMIEYKLDKYIVKRDKSEYIKYIIIKELSYVDDLPELYKEIGDKLKDNNGVVTLYKTIKRNNDTKKYDVWLEFEDGTIVEESKETYKPEHLPFLHLRWTSISGEDYGRSMVEQYFGDVVSNEGINQNIQEFTAAAAKIVNLVDPNSYTSPVELSNSKSGDYLIGSANDVTTISLNKSSDFSIVDKVRTDLRADLARAFLMTDSIRRNAERVTAEEIQTMANELETSLGGIYSILSQEFQVPFVKILMNHLKIKLDENLVKASIVTGLDAIGRTIELQKLNQFIGALNILPDNEKAKINYKNILTSYSNFIGINTSGYFYSDEEIQKEQDRQMAQQMMLQQAQISQQTQPQEQQI